MTRYLVDADCVILALAGDSDGMRRRFSEHEPGEISISAISFAEVALGTWQGKPPQQEVLDAFLRIIPAIPFDAAAAREYARLSLKRARFDRLLAAHALSIGATVVTNNEADFADVPGLSVENWTR